MQYICIKIVIICCKINVVWEPLSDKCVCEVVVRNVIKIGCMNFNELNLFLSLTIFFFFYAHCVYCRSQQMAV